MRWTPRPEPPLENTNPHMDWVRLRRFWDNYFEMGWYWPRRCQVCKQKILFERMYYRKVGDKWWWKCGVCRDLQELAGEREGKIVTMKHYTGGFPS